MLLVPFELNDSSARISGKILPNSIVKRDYFNFFQSSFWAAKSSAFKVNLLIVLSCGMYCLLV